MKIALLLLGHLVRADIFNNASLEKVLSDGLKASGAENEKGASPGSPETAVSSSSMASMSSASIPSSSQVATSTVASSKKSKEETPIIIITQEGASKEEKGRKNSNEQEEKLINVVKNAVGGSKSNVPPVAKNEVVEGEERPGVDEFREMPGKKPSLNAINGSPSVAKVVGSSSDADSYWTTVVVDNKLRKVKVNVKVMTVVESIDDMVGSSREGDGKKEGKKFSFWGKSEEKAEKSKEEDVPAAVSVPYGRGKDEKKTSVYGKSASSSVSSGSGGEKTMKSIDSSKYSESEAISEKSTSARKESESASVTSSKASASAASISAAASAKKSSESIKSESSSSKSKSTMSTSTVSALLGKGKELATSIASKEAKGVKSMISGSKDKSKHGAVTTALMSYVTSQSPSVSASTASISKSQKKPLSSTVSMAQKSSRASTSVSLGAKKQKEATKDSKSTSIQKDGREGRASEMGKKEVKEINPEMNELFYVLKNMPSKISINKSGGKMFVEGSFVTPKEEKLKDKKFKFSGYIQATRN